MTMLTAVFISFVLGDVTKVRVEPFTVNTAIHVRVSYRDLSWQTFPRGECH